MTDFKQKKVLRRQEIRFPQESTTVEDVTIQGTKLRMANYEMFDFAWATWKKLWSRAPREAKTSERSFDSWIANLQARPSADAGTISITIPEHLSEIVGNLLRIMQSDDPQDQPLARAMRAGLLDKDAL